MAMPIKPENKSRYPRDWNAIRDRILRRAGMVVGPGGIIVKHASCEGCGAENYSPHPETGSHVVLTIAHLDHTPENCDDLNLRAWCQKCHNTYDMPHRVETRRSYPGQGRLFT